MRYQKFSFDIYQVLSYRERKLALLILKVFWNYYQVAKHWITCKCHLRVKFFAWCLSFCLNVYCMRPWWSSWESSPLPSFYSMALTMTAYTTKKETCQTRAGTLIVWPKFFALNLYQNYSTAVEYFDMLIFLSCVMQVKTYLWEGYYQPCLTVHFRQYSTGWVILDLFI